MPSKKKEAKKAKKLANEQTNTELWKKYNHMLDAILGEESLFQEYKNLLDEMMLECYKNINRDIKEYKKTPKFGRLILPIKNLNDFPLEIKLLISHFLLDTFCSIYVARKFVLNQDYENYMLALRLPAYNCYFDYTLEKKFNNCMGLCKKPNSVVDTIIKLKTTTGKTIKVSLPIQCNVLYILYRHEIKNDKHLGMLLFTYYCSIGYISLHHKHDVGYYIEYKKYPLCGFELLLKNTYTETDPTDHVKYVFFSYQKVIKYLPKCVCDVNNMAVVKYDNRILPDSSQKCKYKFRDVHTNKELDLKCEHDVSDKVLENINIKDICIEAIMLFKKITCVISGSQKLLEYIFSLQELNLYEMSDKLYKYC